jgi:hypothetical protein
MNSFEESRGIVMRVTRRIAAALVAGAALISLAGCEGGSTSGAGSTSPEATASTPTFADKMIAACGQYQTNEAALFSSAAGTAVTYDALVSSENYDLPYCVAKQLGYTNSSGLSSVGVAMELLMFAEQNFATSSAELSDKLATASSGQLFGTVAKGGCSQTECIVTIQDPTIADVSNLSDSTDSLINDDSATSSPTETGSNSTLADCSSIPSDMRFSMPGSEAISWLTVSSDCSVINVYNDSGQISTDSSVPMEDGSFKANSDGSLQWDEGQSLDDIRNGVAGQGGTFVYFPVGVKFTGDQTAYQSATEEAKSLSIDLSNKPLLYQYVGVQGQGGDVVYYGTIVD